MKALINTFGTAGDNNPFVALALALRAQGHEPVLVLNPFMEEQARRRGLRFIPAGTRWNVDEQQNLDRYLHPRASGPAIWRDICVPNIGPTYRAMREAIESERPDVVVAHFLCLGASWAARAAGVPDAVVTLAPCWWMSREQPSVYAPEVPPRWLAPHLMWLPRAMINRFMGPPLEPVCRELGLPYRQDWYFRNLEEAQLNVGLWPAALRPPAGDDPPRARICGFAFEGDGRETAPPGDELQAFLDKGPPPVVVGLGTSARNLGTEVYAAVAGACEDLGERCVLVGPERPDGLPPSALAIRFAPYAALFPRARAVVHHGGVNTTAEALRAGVPTVIVPFANDQYDNALRAERFGTSTTLSRKRLQRARVAEALRRTLLPERVARAREAGEKLRAEGDGAVHAARAIAAFAADAAMARPRA